ncbi:MAG: T9SS type A sorting domain-containing protein [Bacteroidetes bacterium]|nr:T9SS type A sorting domain-containing protein [Bacteroidota bacterium]
MQVIYALLLALLPFAVGSQTPPTWELLPNSPTHGYRFEDLEAVSPQVLFITNGSGEIFRTTDGGDSWELRYSDPQFRYFRSLAFVDENHGWVGLLDGGDVLYETTDGGETIMAATPRISGPLPQGICGIYALDSEAVYAAGAIIGGAHFLRTLDSGVSWTSLDLSAQADFFVDVYFRDRQHGFLTGQRSGKVIILGTDDGGATWTERFLSTGSGEWGWKLHFPTPLVGYVSVETNGGAGEGSVIKTTDGGQTWQRVATPTRSMQGVGFVSEQTGWYGGRGTAHVTTDGGLSWTAIGELGQTVNRFAFFGDSLAFGAAEQIWRFGKVPLASEPTEPSTPTLWIGAAYPNPFPERVLLPYRLLEPAEVTLEVFDTTGRRLALVERGLRPAGPDELIWDARDDAGNSLPSGVYLYRLTAGTMSATGRLVRIRPER